MGYPGAQGKLIHEKILKLKILRQTPFNPNYFREGQKKPRNFK
jgi:hypothetical protein